MPTTGHFYADAGSGRRTERVARSQAIRAGQQMQALPVLPDVLHTTETRAFAREWAEDNAPRRNVARDMLVHGVLGYALVRSIQGRRG